jgi:hypothetical protein
MSKITITDPTEGTIGYWSIEVVENQDVIADMDLAPEILPGFDDPADLAEYGEALQRASEVIEEVES